MKKVSPMPQRRIIHVITWMCLLFTFTVVFHGQLSAQTERKADYVSDYIAKNPNSALVKYYLANPLDTQAANAIKCASILSSPSKANFTQADIDRMSLQVAEVNKNALEVQSTVKDPKDYERAVKASQAAQNRKAASSANATPTQRTDENGKPIFSIPAQK